jgi:hypothetical protein
MKAVSFTKTLLLTVLSVAFGLSSFAQPPAKDARPFLVGETLTYEAKISRIIKGIAVADLSFTLTNPAGTDDLLITSEARSKGTLVKLFRYSFLQQFQSRIDGDSLRILGTAKHDVQRERVRDSAAIFDYGEKRVTYVETDPNDVNRPPRKIASAIGDDTNDLVSGVYKIRTMPLTVGKSFEMAVSDSGLVYKVPVKVTARELQKTIFGKIWCFRVEPDIFGPGRLIERDGRMSIWLTDDARRLAVRSQINTEYGRVEVKLKKALNIK